MNGQDITTDYEGRYLAMKSRGGWEFASRNSRRPAVGIVAITDLEQVVLVEQYRPPVGSTVIELPAGLSGDIAGLEDEQLLEAAKRELLEETGYVASRWTELINSYSSPGLTDEAITLFLAEGLLKKRARWGDLSENINVYEVSLDDTLHWLRRRQAKVDLKLLAGVFAAIEEIRMRESKRDGKARNKEN